MDLTRTDAIWEGRRMEEWRGLAGKYRFRYVVSRVNLDLPLGLGGTEWKLYTIP